MGLFYRLFLVSVPNSFLLLLTRGMMLLFTVAVSVDSDFHPPMIYPSCVLPCPDLFQASDIASALAPVTKTLGKCTNQKALTRWFRSSSPSCMELQRLRAAYPSLDQRLAHLSPVQLQGSHKPFDLNHRLQIKHQPNAFLKSCLSSSAEGMSQHQMALYLKLLLGLSIPAPALLSSVCACGQQQDYFGYHRLNCKQNAGRANRSAHDIVQLALKKELQRLSRSVVDNDAELRARYSHLTSKKRGDLAITYSSDWQLYDPVSRQPRSDFIVDVKMVSPVNSRGTWSPAQSLHKTKLENPSLVQQEQIKIRKRANFYAPIGFAFFPFVVSSV